MTVRFRAWVLAALLTAASPALLFAQDQEPAPSADDVVAAFGRFGYSEKREISAGSCKVFMTLDQRKFLESVPVLQKLGILNSELSQASINLKPMTLSMAFAVQLSPIATHNVYQTDASVDQCSFIQLISYTDDYGHTKTDPAYSYKFTRSLDRRINWKQFQSQNMAKVAIGFKFSPKFQQQVSSEQ